MLLAMVGFHPEFGATVLTAKVSPKNGYTVKMSSAAATRSNLDFAGSAWCPRAACPNSDLCRPCQRRFLIVLATGRSASTTLTYMLDSLPGIRMSGENNDELKAIRRMMDNIHGNQNFESSVDQKTPWGHHRVPEGAYSCVGQHMVETINPPSIDNFTGKMLEDDSETIVGFKTVRFLHNVKEDEIESLVDWVKETFPCTRFVVNIRSSVDEQAASWIKSFGSSREATKFIAETNRLMSKVASLLGDQAYLADSSDWLKDIDHFNKIVDWLGFDRSCFFDELLEFNTKGQGYGNGRTNTHHNLNCHYVA